MMFGVTMLQSEGFMRDEEMRAWGGLRAQARRGLALVALVALAAPGFSGCCCLPGGDEEPEARPRRARRVADGTSTNTRRAKRAKPKRRAGARRRPRGARRSARTTARPGEERVPLLRERREAIVDVVWFARSPRGVRGGTSPVTIRVEPNRSGEPSVGIVEEVLGGAGDQWKASAWIAAFNASRAVGRKLTDYEFLVKNRGQIDGPSAGMLFTAAMMALMRGDSVRPDTTMTGTINPDGTAGPVGGIVQKMQGAKRRGKKRFGFPIGTRRHRDMASGRQVDLVAYGRSIGIRAQEIRDLRDAYAFLTGKKLPRVRPVSEADMALDPKLSRLMKQRNQSVGRVIDQKALKLRSKLARTPAAVRGTVQPSIQAAVKLIREGQALDQQNRPSGAHIKYVKASLLLSLSDNQLDLTAAMMRRDIQSILRKTQGLRQQSAAKIAPLSQSVQRRLVGKTVGGRVNAVNAYTSLVLASSFHLLGEQHLQQGVQLLTQMQRGQVAATPRNYQLAMQQLSLPMTHFSAAEAMTMIAREQLQLTPDQGDRRAGRDFRDEVALARAYGSAGRAGLRNFEALIVGPLAKKARVSPTQASAMVGQKEMGYLLATQASQGAQLLARLGKLPQDSAQYALLQLAAGAYTYMKSAALVNKHYSLGASIGPDGSVRGVKNRRALGHQLRLARRMAREAAARARASVGFIPAAARIDYQRAVAYSTGDGEDRLEAISTFWMAAFWCELAMALRT